MSAILNRLIKQLMDKGHSKQAAMAIAVSALQKSGNLDKNGKATQKGRTRGAMTPSQRAKDRASKQSGHPAKDYVYNPRTNRATLKRKY